MSKLDKDFKEKVFELTGDSWVPYPYEMFKTFILNEDVNDGIKKLFIQNRRKMSAPQFFNNEPMSNLMEDVINNNIPEHIKVNYGY
jgi:hypothetical protein